MDARPEPSLEPAWIVTDGAAGNLRQAQALADALSVPAREFVVRPAPPWGWLAPHLRVGAALAMPAPIHAALREAAPALVVGCGRRAALVTAWLRRAAGAFVVQVLDPRADPRHWDLVVAPTHDRLFGDNVLTVTGALHAITPAALAEAAVRHADLARIATPRTAVLVGGPTRDMPLRESDIDALCELLAGWQAHDGGGIMASTSRRTPAALATHLRERLASLSARVWCGEADGTNPYLGILAHAQRLVVSADSANLMTEACATGKPVFAFAPHPPRGRVGRLHHDLVLEGRVRPLRDLPSSWDVPAVARDAPRIAAEVRRRVLQSRTPAGD